ncbi:cytochrome-c peroxidase [Candidatus Methylomirabilis sp.]|uniref:cytochrome-c peroxidase n=1 Tax=Candidatus Methylomirabilis sp. TaxID=2032687 RepID=UPI002A622AF2|nr:cytochrome-c peroxidase [Candidatus Methylomirabilis sp.]
MRRGIWILSILVSVSGLSIRESEAEGPYKLKMPLGLQEEASYIPPDNPLTIEKINLGKQLYFDKRLSADGTVACATCHAPDKGFSDGRPTSTGIKGQVGGRNAPVTINRLFSQEQFWDGRSPSLEDQALGPVQNPIEMGHTLEGMVATVDKVQGYRAQFKKVFGTKVTKEGVAQAIASFERTLLCGNSAFDKFKAGDQHALTKSAQHGLTLFNGKANCVACHTGFNFTDEGYHNLGVGIDKTDPDLGRFKVTKKESDKGTFKTPTLRNIAASAPYLHDGSAKTLDDVIELYNKGGVKNPNLSNEIRPLNLTAKEKADLVAFLESLSCPNLQVAAPALPK